MPFNKLNIDDIIHIHKDNKELILNIFKTLEAAHQIFEVIDKSACSFKELLTEIISCNNTESATLNHDVYLEQFINECNIQLATKVLSESGCSGLVIKENMHHCKSHTYNLSYKLHDYKWIRDKPLITLDNISIIKTDDYYKFKIGYTKLEFKILAKNTGDIIDFVKEQLNNINCLRLLIDKNTTSILTSMDFINRLVKSKNLFKDC